MPALPDDPELTQPPVSDPHCTQPPQSDPDCTQPPLSDPDYTQAHSGDSPGHAGSGGLPEVPGYVVHRQLARGGMGRVLAATDLSLGREVAIKVLLADLSYEEAAERFVRESKITARLPHPGIPPVHQLGTLADGLPFLAMKLIRGRTLTEELRVVDRVQDLPRLVLIFEQICQAVGFAHSQGIIHRDLKPTNIMVGAFGEIQVMDWGLAKDTRNTEHGTGSVEAFAGVAATRSVRSGAREEIEDGSETQAGSILGTPAYMAPEQARGEVVDARADVFALGGVLCEILTGRQTFTGKSTIDVLDRVARGDVGEAHLRLEECAVDAELVALAVRCLNAKAEDRPADAGEVATLVAKYRAGVEMRLREAERFAAAAEARAAGQRQKRKVQLALAGSILLLLASGLAFSWWQNEQEVKRQRVEREQEAAATVQKLKDEQARSANGLAVAELLERLDAALRADDAILATTTLGEIDRRANQPGGEEFQTHIERRRAELHFLTELDRIEATRWVLVNAKFPQLAETAPLWAAAFAHHGIVPGQTHAGEVAARLQDSPIRERVLEALELWFLASIPDDPEQPLDGFTTGLHQILTQADPDPLRDAVRTAARKRDWQQMGARLAEPMPENAAQPPRFVVALASAEIFEAERRRALLEAAWVRSTSSFSVLMALGKSYPINRAQGASERVRWFQAAVALRPKNLAAWQYLGVALTDAGRSAEALAALREAEKLEPDNTNTLVNLGVALRATGNLDDAIAAYRRAIAIDPDSTDGVVHNNLGSALADKDDLEAAIASFRESLRRDPDSAYAHRNLGRSLFLVNDLDGAREELSEAIRLDPQYAASFADLGDVLRAQRDPDGAIAAFQKAIELDRTNAGYFNGLGNALWDADRIDLAILHFREAIRIAPSDPASHYYLGTALMAKEDARAAVAAFREVVRLDPRNMRARNNLGIVLRATGQVDEAIVVYRELIALAPNYANAHNGLGNALKEKNDLDGAIAEYREALRIDPRNPGAKVNLEETLEEKAKQDAKRPVAPAPREVKR